MNEVADENRFVKLVGAGLKQVRNGVHGRHWARIGVPRNP